MLNAFLYMHTKNPILIFLRSPQHIVDITGTLTGILEKTFPIMMLVLVLAFFLISSGDSLLNVTKGSASSKLMNDTTSLMMKTTKMIIKNPTNTSSNVTEESGSFKVTTDPTVSGMTTVQMIPKSRMASRIQVKDPGKV